MVYEAPAGWHWASRAEVAAIMDGGGEARRPRKNYQGRRALGGVNRRHFIFSNSLQVGGYLGPGYT